MLKQPLPAIAAALFIAACGGAEPPAVDNTLPALGADGRVSVTGISSGGYMAGQYQVAFSDQVSGSALVAAGPWACSGGSVSTAIGPCVSGEGIDVEALAGKAEEMAAAGRISATAELEDHRVLLFSASDDVVVSTDVVAAASDWFESFVSPDNIARIFDRVPGVHGWLTFDYGVDCQSFESPYINNCTYDLAGTILGYWYGRELTAPGDASGRVIEFDQSEFGDASLTDLGYAFVPNSCSEPGCDIVVFFHGCQQSAEVIGTELVWNSGFNRWAASNSMVVLYPQVQSSNIAPMNPLGCWDWWGYTGDDYLSRSAPQLAAINAMVARLASAAD